MNIRVIKVCMIIGMDISFLFERINFVLFIALIYVQYCTAWSVMWFEVFFQSTDGRMCVLEWFGAGMPCNLK